ncbi:MAG: sigma 54-interacting transcriptional regulator [Gammaproteobacteria bacterium]|nr:sigma 54-interacting transcriptional regulator [Gammaproteobacteria bacterium]
MDRMVKPSCEQIIDILPEPFVVMDRNYRILAANRAYLERFQKSADEVVGQCCHKVSHHSDVPCSQHGELCPLEEVFRTGKSTQVMHIHYDCEGHEEYVQLRAAPIVGEDGEVLYMGETIHPVAHTTKEACGLVGRSRPWLHLVGLLQRAAPTDATVLLQGESGVGKECVAEYIHQFSRRTVGPFMVLDCGAINDSLIESELFGHEKAAFTGADKRKIGLFEAARGGTLFIDEIGEMPLAMQTRLLRALETGKIRRVGGTEYIDVDVRIIAATNRDLRFMIQEGQFRNDLYYRLSAFPVQIPALRDHIDDIPALTETFLSVLPDGDRLLPLSPEVIESLLGYDYPGNVRELRNIIERAAILAGNEPLRPEHLVFGGDQSVNVSRAGRCAQLSSDALLYKQRRLNEDEVMQALAQAGGHRGKAASSLGVGERTLYRYISRMRKKNPGA